jgi:ubiquinone/menaquinone biosynthesis C-methylase UbiE
MSALKRLGLNQAALSATPKYSETQEQTKNVYSFLWAKRDAYESDKVKDISRQWIFERYCDNKSERLRQWLAGERKIILDAGCGSGYSALLFFGQLLKDHDYLGVDISDAVDVARVRFKEAGYPGDFIKMNLMDLPLTAESVDMIYSDGVLHHTDNTEKALKSLTRFLKVGGRFLFYVYAKKAVIREFTDDYIRQQLLPLSDEEAWKALEPLTKLGKALGELHVELEVPEDIPFLGIKKGKMDIQRFFYWNICKMYYRPELTQEEMNHTNYDWFRPLNCHRHTPEEIKKWCSEIGLTIEHMNLQESGISVVAVKT